MKLFLCFFILIIAKIINANGNSKEGRYTSVILPSNSDSAQFDYSKIDNIFVFGDSYTSIGIDYNTLEYSGVTSSGAENWILKLVKLHDMQLWNFAWSGATVSKSFVDTGVPSFEEQYQIFDSTFTAGKPLKQWETNNTLFAIWFGINDINLSPISRADTINESTTAMSNLISKLYYNGARNFLIINVPLIENLQYIKEHNVDTEYITSYNEEVKAKMIKFNTSYPDTNVFIYNSYDEFKFIMENHDNFNINNINDPWDGDISTFYNYFWLDFIHPTSAVHEILSKDIHEFLNENSITKSKESNSGLNQFSLSASMIFNLYIFAIIYIFYN